jgi:hypothetical protein
MKGLTILILLLSFNIFAQNNWTKEYRRPKQFIQNKGQFDEFSNKKIGRVEYAVDLGKTKILFGQKGITYTFLDSKEVPKEERQALAEKIKINSLSDYKIREKVVGKFHFI